MRVCALRACALRACHAPCAEGGGLMPPTLECSVRVRARARACLHTRVCVACVRVRCVCACACARARARLRTCVRSVTTVCARARLPTCVRTCVCVCVRERARVCVRVRKFPTTARAQIESRAAAGRASWDPPQEPYALGHGGGWLLSVAFCMLVVPRRRSRRRKSFEFFVIRVYYNIRPTRHTFI